MEILLNDSLLYEKLSEEGGLILPHLKPAGFLQKLCEAHDGREKIPPSESDSALEMNAALSAFCGKTGTGMGQRA